MLQLEACSLKAKQQGAGGTASALSMVLNVRACVCLSPSSPLSPCLSQSPSPSPVTVRFGVMKGQHTSYLASCSEKHASFRQQDPFPAGVFVMAGKRQSSWMRWQCLWN